MHTAKVPKLRQLTDIKRIVVHCTAADNWSIEGLIDYHLGPNHISSTGNAVCSYADVIFKGGDLQHIVNYTKETWHVGNWNYTSLGIALMFNPTKQNDYQPSDVMYQTLVKHISLLALRLQLLPKNIIGHKELKDTGWFLDKNGNKQYRKECPGRNLNLDILRQDCAFQMQLLLNNFGYQLKIDGLFGKKSINALKSFYMERML